LALRLARENSRGGVGFANPGSLVFGDQSAEEASAAEGGRRASAAELVAACFEQHFRTRPAAGGESAVPTQRVSGLTGKLVQAGRGSKRPSAASQRPIRGRQLRPCRLPAQARKLATQDEDLQLLRPALPAEQPDEREHIPNDEIRKGPKASSPPSTTTRNIRTYRRFAAPRTSLRSLRPIGAERG
jgi:hypothetical protein